VVERPRQPPASGALLSAAVAAVLCGAQARAQDAATPGTLEEVVVTGTTSRDRTVLTSSADVIPITTADLDVKAPRSTDEILELVPGMFVEATAGAVSNNYSVRGLPGGGQAFVQFMEDGLLIAYPGTGNPDELFSYDLNVRDVEAVLGGSSGVLTPNGAGATINFITRKPNFDAQEAIVRAATTTYADRRIDFYYSQPIVKDLAFNFGGYLENNRGTRDAGISYDTYHLKAELAKKWDNGASVILSGKIGDQHDPYYADMPYTLVDGKVHSFAGTNGLKDNIAGPAFANIGVPTSCVNGCYRTFSLNRGVEAVTRQVRIDGDLPVAGGWDLFVKARYLNFRWDFNGVFPGSGTGNAGLDTAVNYLDPTNASSPIASLLTAGAAAFPGTAQFGIRDLTTGAIIAGSDTAALNALNGNGVLQQTWLNRQLIYGHDFGSNVGARWETDRGALHDSLTLGVLYNQDHRYNDQSSVSHVINGVTRQSHIYDVVALGGAGQVLGALTDRGLVSYGDWGTGIWNNEFKSLSTYINNEMTLGGRLHVDAGARWEKITDHAFGGNASPTQVGGQFYGVTGPASDLFDGTYTQTSASHSRTSASLGVNYTFDNNLALYAQWEHGFQMDAGNSSPSNAPTTVQLWELGGRYSGHGLTASVGLFQTNLYHSQGGCFDPNYPTASSCNLAYDVESRGVEYDLRYRPLDALEFSLQGAYQKPKLKSPTETLTLAAGDAPLVVAGTQYDGNVNDRTPQWLSTLTAAYLLPDRHGRVYATYRYVGAQFVDIANQLKLPAYQILNAGVIIDLSDRLNLNVSGQNLTNKIGMTEGNPRQGVFAQSVVNGSFYGRSIAGRNGLIALTYTFK
jgi:outer membrane receptor protein involved in Fe transport